MNFSYHYQPVPEISASAYWMIFSRDSLLVLENADGSYRLPCCIPSQMDITVRQPQHLGTLESRPLLTGFAGDFQAPEGFLLVNIRLLMGKVEDDLLWLAFRALHLNTWMSRNKFCGACGQPLQPAGEERALHCPACGNTLYPRISPAVIVAITRGTEEILLAHSGRFQNNMYSLIAGFVEAGETLEACVHREIMEETGLRVRNVRYVSSQPWPFPDSLMTGFTAEYDSGEIKVDGIEVLDAQWFTRDNLPVLPGHVSIARKLIDAWIGRHL